MRPLNRFLRITVNHLHILRYFSSINNPWDKDFFEPDNLTPKKAKKISSGDVPRSRSSKHSAITENILAISSGSKIVEYYEKNGSEFNLINYLALLKQIVTLNSQPSTRVQGTTLFASLLFQLDKLIRSGEEQIDGRKLSNAYYYLWKLRYSFYAAKKSKEFESLLTIIEKRLEEFIDLLSEQEISNVLSVVILSSPPRSQLRPKLITYILANIDKFKPNLLISVLTSFTLNSSRYKDAISKIISKLELLRDEDISEMQSIEYFSLINNLAKIHSPAVEGSFFRRVLMKAQAKTVPGDSKEFNSLVSSLILMHDETVPVEVTEFIVRRFREDVAQIAHNKKLLIQLFIFFGKQSLNTDIELMTLLYKTIFELKEKLIFSDLLSMLYYFKPVNEEINKEFQEFAEFALANTDLSGGKDGHESSEIYSRLLLGVKNFLRHKTLTDETLLKVVNSGRTELKQKDVDDQKEQLQVNLVIATTLQALAENNPKLKDSCEKFSNKVYFLYVRDFFDKKSADCYNLESNKKMLLFLSSLPKIKSSESLRYPLYEAAISKLTQIMQHRIKTNNFYTNVSLEELLTHLAENEQMIMRRPEFLSNLIKQLKFIQSNTPKKSVPLNDFVKKFEFKV
jgi:hypothetical protein